MSSVLSFLLSYVLLYRYAALFVLVFAAGVALPLPENAMLLAVGAFAGQGYFSFTASLLTALGANVLGDCFDYVLARRYGGTLVRRLRLDRSRFFVQVEEEVNRDAGLTVFFTRFAGVLGPVVNVVAGAAAVPLAVFLGYDFLGNGAEVFGVLSLGYLLGSYWENFSGALSIATGIVAVAVILFILFRISRRLAGRMIRS